jgi:serine-type D-Ala-D-Ala carboxypeptidase/endopeptidase (penicillin-binding protein 4)
MHLRLFLLALLTPTLAAQTSLCDKITALTQDPSAASAHWGIMVTQLDGTPLCAINEAQLFRPASNNKIFTTAAALNFLGSDRTFNTEVVAEGSIINGVLTGNLKLVGGGDANFGARDIPYLAPADRPKPPKPAPTTIADIEELADKVYATGLRTVKGDIVGVDTHFSHEPYPPSWSADDLIYGYAAPVSALTIHDNQIDFTITPKPIPRDVGQTSATVTQSPDVPYYQIENNAVTVRGTRGGCDDELGYHRDHGSSTLLIAGGSSPDSPPCQQSIAINDPAAYAALALKLALQRRGVVISGIAVGLHRQSPVGPPVHDAPEAKFWMLHIKPGSPQADCQYQSTGAAPPPEIPLAQHTSPRLIDDILFTNKTSQNLHAEIMLRNLGTFFSPCNPSQSAGVFVIRQFLLQAGVDPKDFILYDGSGLSDHDLVTPRAFTKFLAFAATQPWFQAWKSTLPTGGTDGTLAARFKPPLNFTLSAKTGTLGETRALSGYLTTSGGQQLIFSILVDNHLPTTTADRTIMDKIVTTIASQP